MSYSEITNDGERMFSPVYHDVWQRQLKYMNGADVKVYFALLAHTTQKDRTWFMSIQELAEDAGVSPSTASAAKDRLVEAGLIRQSWRYRDEAGDYRLTDTRPPPRMQGKNVYTVSVYPGNVDTENRDHASTPRPRKSEPIDSDNRSLVGSENRKQTVAPSPEPPPEPLSPLTPKGDDGASTAKDEPESASKTAKKIRTRHEYPPEFEEFWKMWPNQRGQSKFEVSKKFATALKAADAETILEGARRFADDPNLNVSYCPAPTTWLNNRRWEAGPLPARSKPAAAADKNSREAWGLPPEPSSFGEVPPTTFPFGDYINHEEIS